MAYIILAISIIIEIIGDAMLTASSGYENKLLGIGAIITILFSFFIFFLLVSYRSPFTNQAAEICQGWPLKKRSMRELI